MAGHQSGKGQKKWDKNLILVPYLINRYRCMYCQVLVFESNLGDQEFVSELLEEDGGIKFTFTSNQ